MPANAPVITPIVVRVDPIGQTSRIKILPTLRRWVIVPHHPPRHQSIPPRSAPHPTYQRIRFPSPPTVSDVLSRPFALILPLVIVIVVALVIVLDSLSHHAMIPA